MSLLSMFFYREYIVRYYTWFLLLFILFIFLSNPTFCAITSMWIFSIFHLAHTERQFVFLCPQVRCRSATTWVAWRSLSSSAWIIVTWPTVSLTTSTSADTNGSFICRWSSSLRLTLIQMTDEDYSLFPGSWSCLYQRTVLYHVQPWLFQVTQ